MKKLFFVRVFLAAFFLCALGCSVENEMDGSNSDNKTSGPNILLVGLLGTKNCVNVSDDLIVF